VPDDSALVRPNGRRVADRVADLFESLLERTILVLEEHDDAEKAPLAPPLASRRLILERVEVEVLEPRVGEEAVERELLPRLAAEVVEHELARAGRLDAKHSAVEPPAARRRLQPGDAWDRRLQAIPSGHVEPFDRSEEVAETLDRQRRLTALGRVRLRQRTA
jgi:hypothetical protein